MPVLTLRLYARGSAKRGRGTCARGCRLSCCNSGVLVSQMRRKRLHHRQKTKGDREIIAAA